MSVVEAAEVTVPMRKEYSMYTSGDSLHCWPGTRDMQWTILGFSLLRYEQRTMQISRHRRKRTKSSISLSDKNGSSSAVSIGVFESNYEQVIIHFQISECEIVDQVENGTMSSVFTTPKKPIKSCKKTSTQPLKHICIWENTPICALELKEDVYHCLVAFASVEEKTYWGIPKQATDKSINACYRRRL